MLPLLPDLDRSLCARPTVTEQGLQPCGLAADVRAPEGFGQSWAYCEGHARREAESLERETDSEGAVVVEWKWKKLQALRIALEVA